MLKATLAADPALGAAHIHDISVRIVLSEHNRPRAARMAACHVGHPDSTQLHTTNCACASSLQAIISITDSIALGRTDCGRGAGMESMTGDYGSKAILVVGVSLAKAARDCIMAMDEAREKDGRDE